MAVFCLYPLDPWGHEEPSYPTRAAVCHDAEAHGRFCEEGVPHCLCWLPLQTPRTTAARSSALSRLTQFYTRYQYTLQYTRRGYSRMTYSCMTQSHV